MTADHKKRWSAPRELCYGSRRHRYPIRSETPLHDGVVAAEAKYGIAAFAGEGQDDLGSSFPECSQRCAGVESAAGVADRTEGDGSEERRVGKECRSRWS